MDLRNLTVKRPAYIQAMVEVLMQRGLSEDTAEEALESVD